MTPLLNISIDIEDVVTPGLPTPTSTLYLDNIDQQLVMNVELLFFYHGGPQQGNFDRTSLFRSSLAKLLVPYHFATGRYRVNEERNRVEVVSNRAGALFAGASSIMSIAELGDISAPNPEFRKLIYYPPKIETIEQVPLMTLQVTEFACGGYVLGFSTSHCLFDGFELNNLFRNFAKIVRGDEELHLTLKPVMDKSHLDPVNLDQTEFQSHVHTGQLISLPGIPARVLFNPADYTTAGNPVPPGFYYKLFTFTPDMLASLKRKALDGPGLVSSCSTFEALAAHIWQCRTKIMHKEEVYESPAKLFISMDTRKQLKSSLPPGFAGDSVILAPCTETSYEEVCEKSLAFCVTRVQESIRKVTESFIKSQVRWCEGKNGFVNVPGGLVITAWYKLGLETVDFGSGIPAFVTPLTAGRTDLVVLLPNCVGDGGVNVLIALEFEKMSEFEKLFKSC